MRIIFDKIDGQIKHLVLFDYGLFGKICDKIKYLISKKVVLENSINHNFSKNYGSYNSLIKVDSYNSLPIKKMLTFSNVKILIK